MRCVVVVLFLAVCVSAQGQFTPTHDAAWWNQQADAYKLGYLTGYEAAHGKVHAMCIAENVATEICGRIAPIFVLGLDEKDALARLGSFYKDLRNKDVSVELALILVGDDIDAKAKSEYDHAQSLEKMRQVSEPKPSGSYWAFTAAQLPLTWDKKEPVVVTDAMSADSCTKGGGTLALLCSWTGSTWKPSKNPVPR